MDSHDDRADKGAAREVASRSLPQPGQATVELLLGVTILLLFLAGIVAIGRINAGRLGVAATAREAARSAALGSSPSAAVQLGLTRGNAVGAGYGLTNGTLAVAVDASSFAPGGYVRTTATYHVHLSDLPVLRLVDLPLRATAQELVPLHRATLVESR